MADLVTDVAALAAALARPGQPGETYDCLEGVCRQRMGHRLFTVLAWDATSGDVERVHTSRPDAYPLKGRKPMGPTAWGAHVLHCGEPWRGEGADAIRWAFPDHALILSLGCDSCLNAPVRYDGATLGVVSVLDAAGTHTDRHLAELVTLAPFLVPPLLARTPS